MALAARLLDEASQGPMRFERYMEASLYDDGGYYMRPGRKTGAGADADFATSPVLHPFMGEAVAQEARAAWVAMGRPDPFIVVEFGGGEGDLAAAALGWIDRHAPDLAGVVRWCHVETSPAHRSAQQRGDPRVSWADEMPADVEGLVVAHEFLDALPFAWLERRKGDWAEVCVTAGPGGLAETFGIPPRTVQDAAPVGDFAEGQRVVSMPRARAWCRDVASRLRRGLVLVVDYGAPGMALWNRDRGGSVRGFHRHARIDDILAAEPGSIDITASVDFERLGAWCREAGLDPAPLESQEGFLLRHGALEALNHQERDTVEGASRYLRLRQLVLPQGVGHAYRVLRAVRGVPM